MTIIDDFATLPGLKKLHASQQKHIDTLLHSQKELSDRIRRASEIKEVTKDGIALDTTVAALKRDGGYASTVRMHDDDRRRTVDVYEKQGASHKGWAVRINSYEVINTAFHGGGKVLGLTDAWSKAKAVRVALAWLTFGMILEDGENDKPTT